MGFEADNPGNMQKKNPWSLRSRWFVYVLIILVVSASVAAAGWVYIRHDRGLVFTAFVDKDAYSYEEWINATVEFKNYGFESVHLTFMTSAMAALDVYTSEGLPVCTIPVVAMQAITEVTIGPGQSERYVVGWNQLAYDVTTGVEEHIAQGTYYIVAGTLSAEFHAAAMTSTFTISGQS